MQTILRRLRGVLTLLAILSAAQLVSAAAVTVSRSTTAPSDDLLLSFTGGDNSPAAGGLSWRSSAASGGQRDVGQTFSLPETVNLEAITLKTTAQASGFTNTAFTLTLYKFEAVTANPTALETYVFSGALSSNYASGYLTFSLDSPVVIEAGQAYGFVLSFDNQSVASSVAFQIYSKPSSGGVQPWPGQRLLQNTGSSLTTSQWDTLEFYLTGTAIPEPSSVALLLGAFAAFVVTGRRPRR